MIRYLVIVVGIIGLLVFFTQKNNAQEDFSQFSLTDTSGQVVNIGDLIKGKTAIIDVWATWCPPCRQEIPHLVELYNEYKDDGVIIVGISVDRQPEKVRQFLLSNNVDYPVLFDDGRLSEAFGIRSIPTTYVISKKGKQVDKRIGYADKSYFEAILKKLNHTGIDESDILID